MFIISFPLPEDIQKYIAKPVKERVGFFKTVLKSFLLFLIVRRIKSKFLSRAYAAISILNFYIWKVVFYGGKAQWLWCQTHLVQELALSVTGHVTLELSQSLNSQRHSVLILKIKIIIISYCQAL